MSDTQLRDIWGNVVLVKGHVCIKISIKSMLQRFHVCTPDFIMKVCRGRCCEGANGLLVTIHISEKERIEKLGGVVCGDFLKDVRSDHRCFFKSDSNLCTIHYDKPFGCGASPFTLTVKNTLIIRNRYRRLKCFACDGALPAYISHKNSLLSIIGMDNYNKLRTTIEDVGQCAGFLEVGILPNVHALLVDNDSAKHKHRLHKK